MFGWGGGLVLGLGSSIPRYLTTLVGGVSSRLWQEHSMKACVERWLGRQVFSFGLSL